MGIGQIKYGSFDFKGTDGYPVPMASLSKEFDRDPAGRIIGAKTIVTLEGVIFNLEKDLPFNWILDKEKKLRETFSKDGEVFSLGCSGQTPSFSGVAKIGRYSADKNENNWVSTINYNIELIIEDSITISNCNDATNVASCQDEWSLDTLEDNYYVNSPVGGNILRTALNFSMGAEFPIYKVTRTLGAVGKYTNISGSKSGVSPIVSAKEWVVCRLKKPEGSVDNILKNLQLYNFVRSINLDEPGGSYRITDNWIAVPSGAISQGLYVDSFTVDSSLDSEYVRTVTINGSVKGLSEHKTGTNDGIYSENVISTGLSGTLYDVGGASAKKTTTTSRFDKALVGYDTIKNSIFGRAQCFVEKANNPNGIFRQKFGRDESPMNPIAVSVTEGYNPTEGTVTYAWTFNNKPIPISGAISQTLTVTDNYQAQQVAEIFVLGRRLGPILQDLGTATTSTRDVTFEVVMLKPTGLSGIKFPKAVYQQITGIVESFNPNYLLGASVCKSFIRNNNESWSITEGRFTKTKSWSWTHCSQNIVSSINNQG